MVTITTPLSFNDRRAPFVDKVIRDADVMYANARYILVLDKSGNILEQRFNRRFDDEVVDCLAVFAPCTYKDVELERALVLEIGFRRFVPYAQTEHRLGASTRRGPVVRFRKGEERRKIEKIPKDKKKRAYTIKARVPVVALTDEALFDILPALTRGMQECVDSIVRTWTGTMANVRWVATGTKRHTVWMKHEMEHSISMRIPKDAELLCACAVFAEARWRLRPGGHIDASATAIKEMLKNFLRPTRRRGKDADGNFSDDFVREREYFGWVAGRLERRIRNGYTATMVQGLLDLIGPPESVGRKLVEQIWRIYKIPHPKADDILQRYQSAYGGMEETLLERWIIQNSRSLRLKNRKKKWLQERTSKGYEGPYFSHARNCHVFEVFASQEAKEAMEQEYCARHDRKLTNDSKKPLQAAPLVHTSSEEDDDIPWDPVETAQAARTGTDDDIPF